MSADRRSSLVFRDNGQSFPEKHGARRGWYPDRGRAPSYHAGWFQESDREWTAHVGGREYAGACSVLGGYSVLAGLLKVLKVLKVPKVIKDLIFFFT